MSGLLGCALLEGAVKPLMTSVLLGVSGLDALGNDTELDPPHAERRQAAQRLGGEGRPVIATDPSWNAELCECTLVVRTCQLGRLACQSLATNQVARRSVSDGERVTPRAIAELEVALEVSAPHVVGLYARLERIGVNRHAQSSATRANQSSPLEHLAHRAC